MRSSFRFAVTLLLAGCACFAAPVTRTRVLVVGTIHQQQMTNPSYSYEDVARILETYDPELVCVEIRPQDFRRKRYLDEMELATIWGLAKNTPVRPIDWWPDSSNDRQVRAELSKTPEYQRKAEEEKKLADADPILRNMSRKYGDIWSNPALGYAFWNGREYNDYVAENYRISMQVYGDSPMNLHYQTRNQHMVELVLAAIKERPVSKVVVVTGAEHKHFFDRAFKGNLALSVVDFASILPLKTPRFSGPVGEFLEEYYDLPYYDPKYRPLLNAYYDGRLVDLLHGPDMDFFPDKKISQANIYKAEKLLARWQKQFPESLQLLRNLAWYSFLVGDYSTAISRYRVVAARFEKDPNHDVRDGVMIYPYLGRAYELAGDRQNALACYAIVDKLVSGTRWERVRHFLISMDKPYQREKVFQRGTPEIK